MKFFSTYFYVFPIRVNEVYIYFLITELVISSGLTGRVSLQMLDFYFLFLLFGPSLLFQSVTVHLLSLLNWLLQPELEKIKHKAITF